MKKTDSANSASGKTPPWPIPGGEADSSGYRGPPFTIVFEARLPRDHAHWWCATIHIDDFRGTDVATLDDHSPVRVVVADADRNALDGELRFAGLVLPVSNGESSCTLAQIRGALAHAAVSFRSPGFGGVPVEGKLSLL